MNIKTQKKKIEYDSNTNKQEIFNISHINSKKYEDLNH